MKLKTIILCGLAILVIAALAITAVGGYFGWFGPKTLIVGNESEYKSINHAIYAARDGDTIKVTATLSPYCENVRINKSIKLVGEDKNNTIIDAGGKGTCIYVTADNVHISNFTVKHGEYGIYLNYSKGCKLTQIHMLNNSFGLFIEGEYDNYIDQSNTVNNKPIYYYFNQQDKVIEGLDISHLTLAHCTNFTIKNCNVNDGDGFRLLYSDNNTLFKNNALNNIYGIYLTSSDSNKLINNTANANNDSGIFLQNSFNNTLYSNYIANNQIGISLNFSEGNILELNRMINNTHGYSIEGIYNNSMDESNTINRKPVFYFYNVHGTEENPIIIKNEELGALDIANCTYFLVKSNVLDRGDSICVWESKNIMILNNTLSNNKVGISLRDTSDNKIIGNTILDGAFAENLGVILLNASNNLIVDNNISRRHFSVSLLNSSNNIINNNIINNHFSGIMVNSSDNITITNNICNSNVFFGIGLMESYNCTILNNTASNNTVGFTLFNNASYNKLINNTALNNKMGGILLSKCDFTRISNNRANSNGEVGIALQQCSDNQITDNIANFNSKGIWIGSGDNSVIMNNTVSSNSENGIQAEGSENIAIINNSASNNAAGISLNVHNSSVLNNIVKENMQGIYLKNSKYNKIANNIAAKNEIGIFLVKLSNHNAIINNTISNNSYGISLSEAYNNSLTNNTASLNSEGGIFLKQSSNNSVIGNNVSNNLRGISLFNSNHILIDSNIASKNFRNGINLYESSNNKISNNIACLNEDGIFLSNNSRGNTITNDTLNSNEDSGIWFSIYSSNNLICNNSILNNFFGISLSSSSINNTIANNNISSNEGYGISSMDSSDISVFNNMLMDNGKIIACGISLENATNSTIRGNIISNSTSTVGEAYGIFLTESSLINISDNIITKNIEGIHCNDSTNLKIHYNSISSNNDGGIYNNGSTNINATYNWWGGVPNFDGDRVRNVTYSPYCLDELYKSYCYDTPIEVVIASPKKNSIFELGHEITFNASILNFNNTHSYNYSWTSSIDGDIGDENYFNATLSVGIHVITVTVRSNELIGKDSIRIAVIDPSDNWIVTGKETFSEEVKILNGNLLVKSGGNLTLDNIILKFNCSMDGHYKIEVENGGVLYINNSVITAVNPDYEFLFLINEGAIFEMRNSELHECGYKTENDKTKGLWINADNAVIEKNLITNNHFGILFYNSTNSAARSNKVSNNLYGIYLKYCNNSMVMNNMVFNNLVGIELYETNESIVTINNVTSNHMLWGIDVYQSNNNKINNNIVQKNEKGIHLESSNNNIIANNEAFSNDENGICLKLSSNNTIINNIANLNEKVGIKLFTSSNNTITNNNVSNNQEYGIYLFKSSNNILINNIANLNEEDGIQLAEYAKNNTVKRNVVNSNNYGIWLFSMSNHNIIINNSANNNKMCAIRLSSSNSNKIINNALYNNTGAGIALTSHSNRNWIRDNEVTDNNYGIWLGSSNNNKVIDNHVKSSKYDGLHLVGNDTLVANNNIIFSDHSGISSSHSFDNTITNNNLRFNGKNGIKLSTSNNIMIVGNDINSNINHGIYLLTSNNSKIVENTVCLNGGHDILGGGHGIFLSKSNNIMIAKNNASFNKGEKSACIKLDKSDYITVIDNIANSNEKLQAAYGIYINSSRINLTNNTANFNCQGFSIFGSNNVIEDNTANSNKDNGFSISGANNIISNNSAIFNNNHGFHAMSLVNSQVINNNASFNINGYGFYIDDSCKGINPDIKRVNTAIGNKKGPFYIPGTSLAESFAKWPLLAVIIIFIRETFKETTQRLFGALFEGIEHLTKEIVRRFLMATRGRVSKSILIKLLKRYIHVEAVAKTARNIVVISHPFLNKLSLLWWGTPVVYFTPRIPKINLILMHFIEHRVESIARPKTPGKLSNIHFIISFLRFIDLLKKDMRFRIKTIISVLITATIGLVIGVIILEPFLESMLSPLLSFNFFPLIELIVDFWVLFPIGMFWDHVIVGEVKSITFSLEHDRRTGLLRSQIKTKRNELKEKMEKEENEKRKSKYSEKIISLDEMEREIDNLEDSRRCYYDGREYYLLFTEEGYRKAYSKYNEALGKDSRNALAYAELGETFAFCGKLKEERGEDPTGLYNKSLESCTQAFKINKNLCEAHRAMARILWAQKKIREAEKEIKKALKINPLDAESYHVKALCKYLDADKLKLYKKALELNPNLIIAHRDLGIFYLKQFELDKAKEHFNKIIELNPNDSHAHDSIRAIACLRSINSPHLLPSFGAKY